MNATNTLLRLTGTLLLALVGLISAAVAADLFATKDTIGTAAKAAASEVQALRTTNQEDAAFFQALISDRTFATQVFKTIKSGDKATLQALIQKKYPTTPVTITGINSDFKFAMNRQTRDGKCVVLCFSSGEDSCGGTGNVDIQFGRSVINQSCASLGVAGF